MFLAIVDFFGSQKELAQALGVSTAYVCLWRKTGIPPKIAIQIEALSEGRFKAIDTVGKT